MADAEGEGRGKRRWGFIRRAILGRTAPAEDGLQAVSVRRHRGFEFFDRRVIEDRWSSFTDSERGSLSSVPDHFQLVAHTYSGGGAAAALTLPLLVRRDPPGLADVKAAQRAGVDNTGNVYVWPAEEVMARYALTGGREALRGRRVVELGAGMTALAGLAAAAGTEAAAVVVTDGNPAAAETLARNVELNRAAFGGTEVRAAELKWSREAEPGRLAERLGGAFDVVLVADCLFFERYHVDLLHTMAELVRGREAAGARVLVFGPRRGATADNFCELARRDGRWAVREVEPHDDGEVARRHEAALRDDPAYDPDLHYPRLLELRPRGDE